MTDQPSPQPKASKQQHRRARRKINGWVILDKPVGVTSTSAVNRVRRAFEASKAGHAGTLDPLASGILPIALGEATKTIPFVMDATKDYQFTLKWGEETETDDQEGSVTRTSDHRPDKAEVEAVLPALTGRIMQVPPAYSAIKTDGRRAYDRARNNEVVELAPRPVDIHQLELIDHDEAEARLRATTGKGAYIRSLARDIGRAVGAAAHVVHLRRLRVGPFWEEKSISLDFFDDIDNSAEAFEALHPVSTALDDIPAVAITDHDAERLRCGQKIAVSARDDVVAIGVNDGQLVAILRIEDGIASPQRVFNLHEPT